MRKYYHILTKIAFVLYILFVFVACKSTVPLISSNKVLVEQTVVKNVSNGYLKYDTFSAKIKIDGDIIETRKPLRGVLRIRKDSIIWLSINLSTGIPVAKMEFTPDSFRIIDRIKDELTVGNYDNINAKFGVNLDYNLLQSILLDEFFIINSDGKNNFDKNIDENEKDYQIAFDSNNENEGSFNIIYTVDKKLVKISKALFLIGDSQFNVDYSQFNIVEGKLFPELINFKTKTKEKDIDIMVELSKISVDKKQKYPFKINRKVNFIDE